jgi:spore germination cell wall hydrolase CwlJ-like protein
MKVFSGILNALVLAGMVGVGAYHINEANAQEALRNVSEEDKLCLQQNIFFEARNQSTLGQVAVAWVTLNRVESSRYPDTICEVVKQGRKNSDGSMVRNQCQFSWYCDGKSDKVPDNVVSQRAWEDAGLVAEVVLLDWARGLRSPVNKAIMYHAEYVTPYWTDSYDRVVRVDSHIFYE